MVKLDISSLEKDLTIAQESHSQNIQNSQDSLLKPFHPIIIDINQDKKDTTISNSIALADTKVNITSNKTDDTIHELEQTANDLMVEISLGLKEEEITKKNTSEIELSLPSDSISFKKDFMDMMDKFGF